MADDIARLGLEVDSKDVKKATRELDHLEKQGKKTEGTTRRMTGSFSAMGGAIAALGVGVVVHQIISANAEFSKLHGALTTVTGSAEAANDVVERMKDLMAVVPGDLNEITTSFIKLKALGLDPSEAAMISYSNTAAAMGKDLNQMIEAVADAATGEFERLKEFGIKAASEGDRVKFTFQGVTQEVGKNSQEIQDYLLAIGNTQFAGAAAKQMDTFGGALDNVGSQISALMIADDGLPGATAALKELADIIADPGTKAAMDGLIAGVAQLVQWSAKGATAFVEFGQGIGEFVAQGATGVYLIDEHVAATKSLTQRVEDQTSVFESAGIVQRDAVKNYNDISASLATLSKTNPEATASIADLTTQQGRAAEQVRLTTEALNKERESLDRLTQAKAAQPAATEEGGSVVTAIDPKIQEKLEKQLETLQAYYASDQEAALAALINKQTLITELEEANVGSEEERRELRLEATQEYEDALLEIAQESILKDQKMKDDASRKEKERITKDTAFAIRMMESGNSSATQLLKGYLLDQAKMLGQTAVVAAYKWGAASGGPPGGALAAGVASLAVGALIGAIGSGGGDSASSSAGGGSTVGEGGGIGPAPRGLEERDQDQGVTVFKFEGDPDSFSSIGNLLKQLNEATDRGFRFEVS